MYKKYETTYNHEAHCASNLSKLGELKKLQAQNTLEAYYSADEARFELAEDFTLTRFRGVLLRPLGHSSTCTLDTFARTQMQLFNYKPCCEYKFMAR